MLRGIRWGIITNTHITNLIKTSRYLSDGRHDVKIEF